MASAAGTGSGPTAADTLGEFECDEGPNFLARLYWYTSAHTAPMAVSTERVIAETMVIENCR